MNLKKLRNKVIAAFAVMRFALVTTVGVTYAYWVSTARDTASSDPVEIGDGETTLVVAFGSQDGKVLIPSAYATEDPFLERDTEEITFTAVWTGDGSFSGNIDMTSFTFTTISNSNSGNLVELTDTDLKSMFNVSFNAVPIKSGAANQISIIITLTFENEPSTKAIYDTIANETLTVEVEFTVTPN